MKSNKVVWKCLAINLVLGVLAIAPFIIKDGGMFTLGTDYDAYQIPMYNLLREDIINGNIYWNWNLDLGTDFVGGSSFLILGSPFFWLALLFYKVDYLYLGGWMFILKLGVAGATSGMFLNRFLSNKKSVMIGSVLYAFSGFQAVNLMMGSFHDAVALFPLMLYGLERLITEGKKGSFALAVCINALTNYYLFIGEVIFVVIYFLVRFLWEKKENYKYIGACILEGILGMMMAGILFFPSILFILQNPRSGGLLPVSEWLFTDRRYLLKLWRTFLFPGEMMQEWSCVMEYDWSSSSAYLPMVGMTLVLCYLWKKKKEKDWLKRIVSVSIIFMVVPVLCSVFTLMTDVYCRWYYMPLLLFALASGKVIDEAGDYPVRKIAGGVCAFMILGVIGFAWWNRNRFQIIYLEDTYRILTICGILGVMLTGVVAEIKLRETVRYAVWFILVSVFAVGTHAYTCKLYQDDRGYESKDYQNRLAAMEELGSLIDTKVQPYRLDSTDNVVVMTAGIPPVGAFSNTVQGSVFELWGLLGEERRVYCPEVSETFKDLVGAKYNITSSPSEKADFVLLGQAGEEKQYYLYEKENERALGNVYQYYILEEELLQLPKEERAGVMLTALVVNEEEMQLVEKTLQRYTGGDENVPQQEIDQFERTEKGFSCEVEVASKGFVMFSVPYAKGWKVLVNQEEGRILSTGGFMAVEVGEGIHQIEFTYANPDIKVGTLLSIAGFIIWALAIYSNRRKSSINCSVRSVAPSSVK